MAPQEFWTEQPSLDIEVRVRRRWWQRPWRLQRVVITSLESIGDDRLRLTLNADLRMVLR